MKRIITEDNKWIVYSNVWWDWRGIIFFKLLPNSQNTNSDVHYRLLDELDTTMKQKRPELVNRKSIIFHHDNARKVCNLDRMSCRNHHTLLISHHRITICYGPLKILWKVWTSIRLKVLKSTCFGFSPLEEITSHSRFTPIGVKGKEL